MSNMMKFYYLHGPNFHDLSLSSFLLGLPVLSLFPPPMAHPPYCCQRNFNKTLIGRATYILQNAACSDFSLQLEQRPDLFSQATILLPDLFFSSPPHLIDKDPFTDELSFLSSLPCIFLDLGLCIYSFFNL